MDDRDNMNLSKPAEQLSNEALADAIGRRYLNYALSTIMHRALPDVRDGLKPVHRRILFAMRALRLVPDGGFRKSAKISGDVMGNYHPHGDSAIYDAMVRLTQDFLMRYPLVDGQGNFGNIDGDNAAASRYTEARLTVAAEMLLKNLGEDVVNFRPNYDGTLEEPVVLPAAFPNILANGASGIAVGMATNIPPHNLDELCQACLHLIKKPHARIETLCEYVKGPDFPTGGMIVEKPENILEAYKTGKGGFRLRACYEIEKLDHGQWQIVVTQIPYMVQKNRLIEKIAELIQNKKLSILADIRDESADDVRLILVPRTKNMTPEALMSTLFRVSELEVRISLNMNVLIDGQTPKVCSLKEILDAFLEHKRTVLLRKTRFRIGEIDARVEILEGYLIVFDNIEQVIAIIRYDEYPKLSLMKIFDLTQTQAEAVLNMRLRRLRQLEEIALKKEHDSLLQERAKLENLLENKELQSQVMCNDLQDVLQKFGKKTPHGKRFTTFSMPKHADNVAFDEIVVREPITVICSRMGWIRVLKGHIDTSLAQKFKDGDTSRFNFHAYSTDKIVVFGTDGRFFTLNASNLPGGRGMGEPIRLMIDLANQSDIVALFLHRPGKKLLIASDKGDGFIVKEDDVITQMRAGKQILNLKDDAKAHICCPCEGDMIACVSSNRKMVIFPCAELPQMSRAKGVRMQKIKDGVLNDALCFVRENGMQWRDGGGRLRTEKILDKWLSKRASVGSMVPRGFPPNNKFNR